MGSFGGEAHQGQAMALPEKANDFGNPSGEKRCMMGGSGSGPQRSGGTKWRVEGCHSLNTSDLARWKLLAPGVRSGSFHWGEGEKRSTVSYTLAAEAASAILVPTYTMVKTGERMEYSIRMVTTPCHFGGLRWWFICPLVVSGTSCCARVRKLYLPGRYFGCRTCLDLTYRSTQESDRRVYQAVRSCGFLGSYSNIRGMSVAQLGFALKVIRFQERKLEKIGKRVGGRDGVAAS